MTAGRAVLVTLASTMLYGCTPARTEPRGTVAPIDVAGPPADATRTASGLAYRVLVRGNGGAHPRQTSRITVHFTGWTTDGTVVEGAPRGGDPATFDLSERMRGWREGVAMMSRGDKWRFWIPAALAYAGQDAKPQGMLVYDIDLLDFDN